MKNKLWISVFILLIFIPSTLAFYNYSQTGGDNYEYISGNSKFNAELSDDFYKTSVPLDEGRQTPLVADLDNDGINEIIVLNDDNIELYHSDTFPAALTGLTIANTDYSNMIIYDIDGDNFSEIIIANEGTTENINIIEYNTTHFYIQSQADYTIANYTSGETMIACRGIQDCIIIYPRFDVGNHDALGNVYARGFNATDMNTDPITIESHNGFGSTNKDATFCLPKIRHIAVADYDNNNGGVPDDYIFSFIKIYEYSDDTVYIKWVSNNGTALSLDGSISKSADLIDADVECRVDNVGRYINSPLVFDSKPSVQGLETHFAFNHELDEFKIRVYDKEQNEINFHPYAQVGEGTIISNMIRANVFPDGDDIKEDYCVMGYDNVEELLELVCGSNVNTYELTKLYSGSKFPKEWAWINPDQEVETFFPIPPISSHMKDE